MFEGKYHQENAKNGISERLDFNMFWGSMRPEPLKARAFGASHRAFTSAIRNLWLRVFSGGHRFQQVVTQSYK